MVPQQSRGICAPRTCSAPWTLTPRPVTTGRNNKGQLGAGAIDSDTHAGHSPAIVDVGTDKSVGSVGLGYWHTCATISSISNKKDKINNELKCWGAHPLPHLRVAGHSKMQKTILHAGF